jgi:gliding motility-associated-like protein
MNFWSKLFSINPDWRRFYFLFLLVLGFTAGAKLWASHNLAGQITYTRVDINLYEILLTTYTDPTAAGVDRCTADIEIWGIQGTNKVFITTLKEIPRENGIQAACPPPARFGVFIRPKIKRNYYRTRFYLSPGLYELRYKDVARVNYVRNMSNSGATAFYVATRLNNSPGRGVNNSAVLLNEPLDDACTNKLWTHNPGGYDPDGDSLVYSLINCQQYDPPNFNQPISVSNFQLPSAFGGRFTIDRRTGLITWNTPQQPGVYNIAILVEEYRNGQWIGNVIRDMAIFVEPCNNRPPVIQVPTELCIKAGKMVRFPVKSWDPDPNDSLYLYLNNGNRGFNGPFSVNDSPAHLDFLCPPNVQNFPERPIRHKMNGPICDTVRAEFSWQTLCEHVRRSFYQLDFYAHDNLGNSPTLAANTTTILRVVADGVGKLEAEPGSRKITLRWAPHTCEQVRGYEIYRNDSALVLPVDTVCCTGLPSGYRRIGVVAGRNNTTFIDNNNGRGLDYREKFCYRVVAIFPGGVRSCASADTCVRILRDMPVITNDSISTTHVTNGALKVVWAKPLLSRIDSAFFPPPYTYRIYRGLGLQPTTWQIVSPEPIAFIDTVFQDTFINTQANAYSYRVYLIDRNGKEVSNSDKASSVFLNANAVNSGIRLTWQEYVPWSNKKYEVYRSDRLEGRYDLIATVTGNGGNLHAFTDMGEMGSGLPIGREYCYFIRSVGSYSAPDLKDPLLNDSNRKCEKATDTIPPCLPKKEKFRTLTDCENFQVLFQWLRADTLCAPDLKEYRIFYSREIGGPYRFIETVNARNSAGILLDTLTFRIDNQRQGSIAGCYVFSAIDFTGNESEKSVAFCVDNCPLFEIPSAFTPNGDGVNDKLSLDNLLIRSVKSLQFAVFDRWGKLIHQSTDPTNLWDGTLDGNPVVPGHYYYILELTLDNLRNTKLTRNGGITILR